MPQSLPESQEQSAIIRAIDGDVEAFGELYDLYVDSIYRFVILKVSNIQEAEDLTEIVFIKAFENLPSYRRGKKMTNFRAWLYRIARNLVIDHYRTSKPTLPIDAGFPLPSQDPAPETRIQSLEENDRIRWAIEQLEDPFDQVILMRFIAELTYTETASALGITENYVRVIQYRALRKLRSILEGEEENHV